MSGTIAGLRGVGVTFEFLDRPDHLPCIMTARAIATDRFSGDGRRPSQFVSGLLMAAAVDIEGDASSAGSLEIHRLDLAPS